MQSKYSAVVCVYVRLWQSALHSTQHCTVCTAQNLLLHVGWPQVTPSLPTSITLTYVKD